MPVFLANSHRKMKLPAAVFVVVVASFSPCVIARTIISRTTLRWVNLLLSVVVNYIVLGFSRPVNCIVFGLCL